MVGEVGSRALEEVGVGLEESEERTEAAGGAGEARRDLDTSGNRWGTLHRVIHKLEVGLNEMLVALCWKQSNMAKKVLCTAHYVPKCCLPLVSLGSTAVQACAQY